MAAYAAPQRAGAVLGVMVLAGVIVGAVAPAASAISARTCRVTDVTQGTHFPPDSGQALTDAIAAAMPGDQLNVVGICRGTNTLDKDLALTGISKTQFPTPTLDGGQAGTTLTVDPSVAATLTNLTITGGAASLAGGGIENGGTLTLDSSTVSGNTGAVGGGINNANGGTITVGFSTVSGNTGDFGGGGIENGGTLTLNSSTVSGNGSNFGGGIDNFGTLTLGSSTVSDNSASIGGGIWAAGTVTLEDSSTVSGNTASSAIGGGIFVPGPGIVTLKDSSTVSGNTAIEGGGIYNAGGIVNLASSTVSGNTAGAGRGGGGILNEGGTVTLDSSTISGNTANGNGGGIYNDGGNVNLEFSTVTANTAAFGEGGGIYNISGTVDLDSSTVIGNIPDDCVNVPGC